MAGAIDRLHLANDSRVLFEASAECSGLSVARWFKRSSWRGKPGVCPGNSNQCLFPQKLPLACGRCVWLLVPQRNPRSCTCVFLGREHPSSYRRLQFEMFRNVQEVQAVLGVWCREVPSLVEIGRRGVLSAFLIVTVDIHAGLHVCLE